MEARILIVDDDPFVQEELCSPLLRDGFKVELASSGDQAIERCRNNPPEVVLLDYRMPGMNGMEVLQALRREDLDTGVIMMTGYGDVSKAVEAMRLGAENFLPKPVEVDHLRIQVGRTAEKIQLLRRTRALSEMSRKEGQEEILGRSAKMIELREQLQMLCQSPDATVLFLGESGSGKGYLARWLHQHNPRRDRPFVELNCASFSSNLIESELFGYEKGSFTDAKVSKKGLLEIAHTGVVFLDEIGDLPLELQPKLLTFLEAKRFRRVGGLHEIHVDVQIFAATNHDLKAKVEDGRFRKDLFYRLNVLPLKLAPLRERREDIPPLAEQLYMDLCRRHGKKPVPLTPKLFELLAGYSWPGNIRELNNVLERAFILGGFSTLDPKHLPPEFHKTIPAQAETEFNVELETLEEVEKRHILRMLHAAHGNITDAAKILGIGRSTLFQKIKRYRLEDKTEDYP